jgi:hypothetical protein
MQTQYHWIAYEGGNGSIDYSYQHKKSSDYSNTKPVIEGGVDYPKNGEIDVMKYFNKEPYVKDFDRVIAEFTDVLGLVWLTKIKIK